MEIRRPSPPGFRRLRMWLHLRKLADDVERWTQTHFLLALTTMIVVALANELMLFGTDLSRWDPLYITSVLAFTVGIRLALELAPRIRLTLVRLSRRGALSVTREEVAGFTRDLETRAQAWAERAGLLIALLILMAFVVAFGPRIRTEIWFTIVSMAAGYLAGRAVGRAVTYGTLGSLLQRRGLAPIVQPGHLDGAGGLKPVGEFYFFQAMVLAIPALFLATWWAIIPFLGRYEYWRRPYLALLAVALTVEILAFIAPMYSFHQTMKQQKVEQLAEADELSREVSQLQSQLVKAGTDKEREALKERLSLMTERYAAIERMPSWPVDRRTRRRFTVNNLVLFLPLISKALSLTSPWKDIADELSRLVSQ